MSTTEDDLDYFADRVRFFVDQEIPTVTSWNVDPHVLQDSLRRVGDGFTSVEQDVAALQTTVDGITLPDGSLAPIGEWVTDPGTPTYIDSSTFSLVGDQTANYRAGSRIRATLAPPTTTVAAASTVFYNGGTNQTVITLLTPSLTPALSKVEMSIVRQSTPMARTQDIMDLAVTTAKLADLAVQTAKIANYQVTQLKLALGAVGTDQLAPGAVTNAKVGFKSLQGSTVIADGTLNGNPTITPGSITGDRIAPGAIGPTQLAPNAVGAANIAERSLPNTKLQYYTLRDTEIADQVIYGGAFGRAHIVNGSCWGQNILANKSFNGWDKIADGSINGTQIQNKSLWANDKLADGSMLGYNTIIQGTIDLWRLAVNASLYWVGVFRGGQVTVGQGSAAWLQNNSFPTRGGWVLAAFFVNGWMYAGGPTMGFNVAWYLDGGGGQGYNVTSHDPGEGASGASYVPMTLCGGQFWNPGSGNHTIGIVGSCSATPTKPGFSATVQNSDILVCVFA